MTRLAVILAGLTLSLVAASPAEAARTEFFGISLGREPDAQDIQRMAAARVRTNRFLIQWRRVQPTQGSPFNWAPTDRIVGSLAWRGIQAVPFVWGCPTWVCPGPSRPPVGSAFAESAWRNFLERAVARYGRGGSYWTNGYRQRYEDATPLPISSWQVWNEPNLQKYFDPGETSGQGIKKYAQLVKISHDAIKRKDPQARIVLAGLLGNGEVLAWDFLSGLYKVPGFKDNFDVAALHPYTGYPEEFRRQILRFRGAMTNHGDRATPLWLTEFGWGSANPDRFGLNKGPAGQAQMLSISFGVILRNRSAWNLQRLYWFQWRDPPPSPGGGGCSFCGSAGLLRYDRTPKPAYATFRSFATEWVPPHASITAGPGQGAFISDSTPSYSFRSNEPGSTFVCRVDADPYEPCGSPYTLPQLSDDPHTFIVKAIDAPGNESQVVSRSFTVDTVVPGVTISSGPGEGAVSSNPSPSFGFASNDSDASLSCQLDGGGFAACSSPFAVSSLADGPHAFQVKATDRAQNTRIASRSWTVDTTPPMVTFSSGPANGSTSPDRSPSFGFASNDPSASFRCRLDGGGFHACGSPFSAFGLADGSHTFQVRATDTVQNVVVASRTWTVAGPADVSITGGPVSVTKDPTPSFSFSSLDSDSDFHCRIDGASFTSCTSPITTSELSDSDHTFIVKAMDAARTTDFAWRDFTVDTTAPAVTIKGRTRVMTRKRKRSASFTLTASEHADRRCRIDARPFKPCSWRYRTPKLGRGAHTLKVKASDRVGNLGSERKRFRIARR